MLKIGVGFFILGYLIGAASGFLYGEDKRKSFSLSMRLPYSPNELLIQFSLGIEPSPPSLLRSTGPIGFASLDSLNTIFQVKKIVPLFPAKSDTIQQSTRLDVPQVYLFKFASTMDVSELKKHYQSLNMVNLVEYNYYYFADKTKSKPLSCSGLLQLEEAAPYIEHKNTVIVGIIDTGFDWKRKQFITSLWKNPVEELDKKDNDANGLIDDVWGWNFVDPDLMSEFGLKWESRPCDYSGHGSQITELIEQISNFNAPKKKDSLRNKFMILKAGVQSPDGNIVFTTFSTSRAIIYAVDHGARIINLSWGGEFPSEVLRLALDYASRKGCSLIASAGNENNTKPHYPAAYENAWAVAATDSADMKMNTSSFGHWIDVSAPGACLNSVLSSDSTQSNISGTSLAAAHVSGLATLLLSCQNIEDSDSLKRRIIWSSENIYHKNPEFSGQLGAGRINILRSLNSYHQPNIVIQKILFHEPNQPQTITPGENIPCIVYLKNLSSTARQITIELSSDDPFISVLQPRVDLASLNYQQEYANNIDPFILFVNNDYPPGHQAEITLKIETSNGFLLTQSFILPVGINPPENLLIAHHHPIRLKWAGNSNFIGYQVYRKQDEKGIFTRLNNAPIFDTNYVDLATEAGCEYSYYLTGIAKNSWESPPSDTVAVRLRVVPQFLFDPSGEISITSQDSIRFSVSGHTSYLADCQFQWMINNQNLTHANDSTLILPAISLPDTANRVKVVISTEDTIISHVWNVKSDHSSFQFEQVLFSPVGDTCIYERDSLTLSIQFIPPIQKEKKIQWVLNGKVDSSDTQATYLFIGDYFSIGTDTIMARYEQTDSIFYHQWIVTILNRNRAPEILSATLPIDTTISFTDTLLLSVRATDLDQDSLAFRWYVNQNLDSVAIDSFYRFSRPKFQTKSDTITVQIADHDTSIYRYWLVNYAQKLNHIPQIVSCFPPLDSALIKADSIFFRIYVKDPDGDSLHFSWTINHQIDTTAHASSYLYRNIDSTFTIDTLSVIIADPDTSIKLEWILWAQQSKPDSTTPMFFEWSPEQDSLIADSDSLIFRVHNTNDSSRFRWFINGIVDSTRTDSIFVYYLSEESNKIDTIHVIIFAQDTLFSHEWYIYKQPSKKERPLSLTVKPENEKIILSAKDSLKFSVKILQGDYKELDFLWSINGTADTTVKDTIFCFTSDSIRSLPDTVGLIVSQDDTTISFEWIIYSQQPLSLPAPHLIHPIAGNQVSEDDALIWENDSLLARIDSVGPLTYVVQLSPDTTFFGPILSDSCTKPKILLKNLSGFERISIGKPVFWRVQTLSGQNKSSVFRTCPLPFFYYPQFAKIMAFYGQKNMDGTIVLYWTTSYEKNCAGFNIYRSESQTNNFAKINENLITGQTNYSFKDNTPQAGKIYYYKLEDVNVYGKKQLQPAISITAPTPQRYSLSQNYPNPFNSITSFKYEIPVATQVTIAVYSVLGRKVKTLVDESKEAGFYTVYWDGRDDLGKNVVSGVYFYYMSASSFHTTHKMIVVR